MKQRNLTFLLAMLLSIVAVQAFAYDAKVNGIYYNLNKNNKTASVTYESYDAKNYSGNVVIPETITDGGITYRVTYIGWSAFEGCADLTSITIPNSVEEISNNPFRGCSSLSSIKISSENKKYNSSSNCNAIIETATNTLISGCKNTVIPSNVKTIGSSAFSGCTGLTSITIPSNVTTIDNSAFQNCTGLTSITIPNSVTAIGNSAFSGCTGLTSITIPNSLTEVGANAFKGTPWYDNLPDGVVYIGKVAYLYKGTMPSNTTIEIKEGTVKIGASAFSNCTSLINLSLPNSIKAIDSQAFDGCKNLRSVVFPEGLTNIGKCAFRSCKLSSLELPGSVTTIEEQAFEYCNSIRTLILPEGLQFVGFSAFWNCNELVSIEIPKSLVMIDRNAFNACYGLQTIKVAAGNPAYDSRNDCNALIETKTNKLLTGTVNTIIPEGIESIGDCAFFCNMTSLKIPSTVQSLGFESFSCSNMKSIVVDERNKYLNSFGNCNAIIETATNTVLYGCINTVLPKNVTKIGAYAFVQCRWTEYEIPEGIVDIGDDAFWCNRELTSISFPTTLQNITGQNIFSQCDKLKTVICYSLTPPVFAYGCSFENKDRILYVPKGTKDAYASANVWKDFPEIIEMGNQQVEAYAVLNDGTLTFYYDNQKSMRSGTKYEMNTGENYPGWVSNGFTKVVFDTSFADARPTTTYNWFCKRDNLTKIEGINNLRTDDVTNMAGMFYYCSGLTTLDVSNFNTGNVTNMSSMFSGCSGLTTLDVSGFDTGNVTKMSGMFSGCSKLTSLDVSNFKTGNVTGMGSMFSRCSDLNTIYCGDNWNTDKVTYSSGMFAKCTNLIGGAGTKYDESHTDKEYAHVDGGPSNPGYLTLKGGDDEDGDDLQRYLDSLVDTEDEFVNNVYRRVFLNDDWQALYVPFEMNYSDWADKFEVADIYGFYWYDDDDDNYVDRQELVATIVESGSLQANFPYLIRAKEKTGATLTVNVTGDVSKRITVAYMEISPVTYYFTGNYSQLTGLMSAGRYRLQGGSLFIPLSDSEVLLPYRWYMTMDVASPQAVRLNIVANDETTGIENVKKSQWMIHSTQQSPQQPTVFDLSGRRVDADIKSLPKGIYIINGKKQIIK